MKSQVNDKSNCDSKLYVISLFIIYYVFVDVLY